MTVERIALGRVEKRAGVPVSEVGRTRQREDLS